MKTEITIFDNEWLSLKKVKDEENGIDGYIYSHETRCNGKIVVILPYKVTDDGFKFLLRKEVTPCWSTERQVVSSITGGVESNDVEISVLHELKEEGGYNIPQEDLIPLCVCRGTKSCDTLYYLYSCDLTNVQEGKATGDGSQLESEASCIWVKDINVSEDPTTYTAYYKLIEMLSILNR